MKIIIASGNKNKIREIQQVLSKLSYDVVSIKEVYPDAIDVDETGDTYEENAILKLAHLPLHKDYIYLSDDSGLSIDALDGEPGVKSARYAGPGATYKDLCNKVLGNLGDTTNRSAQFVSVIALKFPDGTIKTVQGCVKGTITTKIHLGNSFGYDPIFMPDGYSQTFSELDPIVKNRISHRGVALGAVKQSLKRRRAPHEELSGEA